jgi:DNA-binding NarL/FixJ family response regulator
MEAPSSKEDSSGFRLLIADKTRLGCDLLAKTIESHLGPGVNLLQATKSSEALNSIPRFLPDVALIAAALADGPLSGFKILPVLQSLAPRCAGIVMLDELDIDLIVDAFRARARGVFFREDPIEQLIKCIRVVHEGQIWVGSRELKRVLDAFAESSPYHVPTSSNINLTKREVDIAILVAAGQSNRQISRTLNLSEHTIKNNLFRIFEKLGITSRVELAISIMNLHQSHPTLSRGTMGQDDFSTN